MLERRKGKNVFISIDNPIGSMNEKGREEFLKQFESMHEEGRHAIGGSELEERPSVCDCDTKLNETLSSTAWPGSTGNLKAL